MVPATTQPTVVIAPKFFNGNGSDNSTSDVPSNPEPVAYDNLNQQPSIVVKDSVSKAVPNVSEEKSIEPDFSNLVIKKVDKIDFNKNELNIYQRDIFSKMSSISSRIISIHKSRQTILSQLQRQGYDVEDYVNFSMNEIDSMLSNSQLDMLLTNKTNNTKIYIKYYFTIKQNSKQIKKEVLDNVIEDLFVIEEILTKKDTLIVIIDDEPNDSILSRIKYLYDHDGIFVIIHNIHRLQFNILEHTLVPNMKILNDKEEEEFMKKYQINNKSQLSEISRFDPQAFSGRSQTRKYLSYSKTEYNCFNY